MTEHACTSPLGYPAMHDHERKRINSRKTGEANQNCMQFAAEREDTTIATHSSTLAWQIPRTEEPGRGCQELDMTEQLHFHFLLSYIGEEMATHSSVLAWRIPGVRGGWWAAVYGVTQSRTRLKQLSSSSSQEVQQFFFPNDYFIYYMKQYFNCLLIKNWKIALLKCYLICY